MTIEVPRVYCDLPGPVPTSAPWLSVPDPYDGSLPGAERMTRHAPDERGLWVARHKVTDCGHCGRPGYTWDRTGKHWVLNPRPVTAADLAAMPEPLARPDERAPWETD